MPKTPSTRSSQYRTRTQLKAMATLLGWRLMDIAGVFATDTGTYVIVENDGSRVELAPTGQPVGSTEPAEPGPSRKVWVPKNWDPKAWERMRHSIIDQSITKPETLDLLNGLIEKGKLTEDQVRTASKVFQALPDTPDWGTTIPEAKAD